MTSDAQTIDLRPKEVNFLIYQGDDTSFTVTFPVSINTTGSSGTMKIKRRSGASVLTLALGSGITLSGQIFTTTITKTQAATLPTNMVLEYDWQFTNSAAIEQTVVVGTIQVKPQK
mgnify:CR=1 FL=1